METKVRVRHSILELQQWYDSGNTAPLENLMRAFKGIKEKDPEDEQSFCKLSSYHGLPYRGPGSTFDDATWGGYCNHNNALFPTWHRVYLYKLEEALRSIPGCEDVTLPYWDQTNEYAFEVGIPWPLTRETFKLDGEEIKNPLISYVLQIPLEDHRVTWGVDNSKPIGYETKRGPLSGLVATEKDRKYAEEHNAQFPNYNDNVAFLNMNLKNWLNLETGEKYHKSLSAPTYTVFSNRISAKHYNENSDSASIPSIEDCHNEIHAAVGGYSNPLAFIMDKTGKVNAVGDMGEIDTAAFDPIFYFHHANVDRMFWLWQKKHDSTDNLEIDKEDPGAKTYEVTSGFKVGTEVHLDFPLNPFEKVENGNKRAFVSRDCINIEKQLGYTYSLGSWEKEREIQDDEKMERLEKGKKYELLGKLHVKNLDRTEVKGTFVIAAFLPVPGKDDLYLGSETIFNRFNVEGCANCQQNLQVNAIFDVPKIEGCENSIPYFRVFSHGGNTQKPEDIEKMFTCHIEDPHPAKPEMTAKLQKSMSKVSAEVKLTKANSKTE